MLGSYWLRRRLEAGNQGLRLGDWTSENASCPKPGPTYEQNDRLDWRLTIMHYWPWMLVAGQSFILLPVQLSIWTRMRQQAWYIVENLLMILTQKQRQEIKRLSLKLEQNTNWTGHTRANRQTERQKSKKKYGAILSPPVSTGVKSSITKSYNHNFTYHLSVHVQRLTDSFRRSVSVTAVESHSTKASFPLWNWKNIFQ